MKVFTINDSSTNVDTFKSQLNKGPWLLQLHADWCGYCQLLKPQWKKFEDTVKNSKCKFNLASIESSALNKHFPNIDVEGYPTIRVFHNGQPKEDYNGNRQAENLIKFVKSHSLNKPDSSKKKQNNSKSSKKSSKKNSKSNKKSPKNKSTKKSSNSSKK